MRKPSGSRFMIVQQLKKVLREAIPRIDSYEAAQALEAECYRARSGGILSDKEYREFSGAIKQICQDEGWI